MQVVEWLFVLAFPNGGSTAIAQILLTAHGAISLQSRAEGQWLIPEMSAPRDRWDANTKVDYDNVRSIWMDRVNQRIKTRSRSDVPPLVIEKSPPSMTRIKSILAMLQGMKTDLVVMTRDPFATIASWHVRYGVAGITANWGWPNGKPKDEDSYFESLGEIWLRRAEMLEAVRNDAGCWIRYEDFATAPAAVLSQLVKVIPRLSTANPNSVVGVKDYPKQPILNMNDAKLSKLTTRQKDGIARGLRRNADLVEKFGYTPSYSNEVAGLIRTAR